MNDHSLGPFSKRCFYADDHNWRVSCFTRPGSFALLWTEPQAFQASTPSYLVWFSVLARDLLRLGRNSWKKRITLHMARTNLDLTQSTWGPLYRIGAIAALVAAFVFRRNLGAELMGFKGFGIFSVPAMMPTRATEWFALLQSNTFVGLALLNVFDLIEYALVGLIFLATYAALRRANSSLMMAATAAGLMGIAVYFASNQAFAMFSLSERYAAAATDAQRLLYLAAGEALLAINNPGALYQGTGIYASLFLVLLAGLIISIVMLRSDVFNKITAWTGILANGFGLGYFAVLAFAPALIVLPFVLSAPFRVTWYILIAFKLFEISRALYRNKLNEAEDLEIP